ncbi:hypothetical protein FQA47_006504 [Oryzias melastigma]|uniref:Uncharacterized protein n=1 Tax=Oryzias melastigma TaxID=30732 RepID=A0A834FMM6_ORYME|nr:hypothetical protein FQA47_006504 [Oryzias melastigma]
MCMQIPLIDWESSGLVPNPHAEVQVPEFDNPLTDDQMELLQEHIDPLQSSESSGMDIYLQTLQYDLLDEMDINQEDAWIPLIDWESSGLVPNPHAEVQVPEFDNPLTDDQMELLQEHIDPLQSSESSGMDIYLQTLQYVGTFLVTN